MIFETIITTRNADGSIHIAPMGVRFEEGNYLISPFKPSTTLDNLVRSEMAVINFTDDVLIFAGCLTGRRHWPTYPAKVIDGEVLKAALAHTEVKVVRIVEDQQRPAFFCKEVHSVNHAPFRGFNRAQAAVLEAAVLVSRLSMLPAAKIDKEIDYLKIAIDKTAGEKERQAWAWLLARIEEYRHQQKTGGGPAMTQFLASAATLEEAQLLHAAGVDIIDLKDPHAGALGALPVSMVKTIVANRLDATPISATIGDLPYRSDILLPKIMAMAETGVDIVKVGVFGAAGEETVLSMLNGLTRQGIRIVLVLFAEDGHRDLDFQPFAAAGVSGVMMDTRDKATGTLRDKVTDQALAEFVGRVKQAGLLCGLAGSLGFGDVLPLLRLAPDYLGFRGALCQGHQRCDSIDKEAVKRLRNLIPINIACGLQRVINI